MQKFHKEIEDFKIDSLKYLRHPIFNTEKPKEDLIGNGVTRVVIAVDIDGETKTFRGMSRCSKKDNFSRARGRAIAIGRAKKSAYLGMQRGAERCTWDEHGISWPISA